MYTGTLSSVPLPRGDLLCIQTTVKTYQCEAKFVQNCVDYGSIALHIAIGSEKAQQYVLSGPAYLLHI